jgi:lysozyme
MINTRTAVGGMSISAALLVTVLQLEGYRDQAYIPVPGDVPTIGAGRTEGVKMGDKTNPVREMRYLADNLEGTYGAGIRKCITVPLHQYEFDSLVDLAYNAGVSAVCREMATKFNAARTDADYASACASIENWRTTVGGRDCKNKKNNCRGLITRRQAQRAQCEGKA